MLVQLGCVLTLLAVSLQAFGSSCVPPTCVGMSDAGQSSESEAGFVVVAAGKAGNGSQASAVEPVRRRASFSAPSRRSAAEHLAISARMHFGKARAAVLRLRNYVRNRLQAAVNQLRHRSIVRAGVGLTLAQVGRNGEYRFLFTGSETKLLAAPAVLSIAFDHRSSRAQLAERHKVDPRTVNRCRALVASTYIHYQAEALKQLSKGIDALAASGSLQAGDLAYVMCSVRFDETQERLSLRLDDRLRSHQQESSWHVLVARRCIAVGVAGQDGGGPSRFAQLLLPNVPLTCTSASAIFDGLWKHPLVGEGVAELEARLLDISHRCPDGPVWTFFIIESDAASANEKLVAHRFNEIVASSPSALCASRLCSCHQNSLVECSSMAFIGLPIVNGLYSISAIIRTRGYFVRLVTAVRQVVDQMIVVNYSSLPPSSQSLERRFACELMEFSCSQYKVIEHAEENLGASGRERIVDAWRQKWLRLLSLLNGVLWQGPGGKVEVFHDGLPPPATTCGCDR